MPSKTGWYHRFLAKPAPTKYYGFFTMTYLEQPHHLKNIHHSPLHPLRSLR